MKFYSKLCFTAGLALPLHPSAYFFPSLNSAFFFFRVFAPVLSFFSFCLCFLSFLPPFLASPFFFASRFFLFPSLFRFLNFARDFLFLLPFPRFLPTFSYTSLLLLFPLFRVLNFSLAFFSSFLLPFPRSLPSLPFP